MTKIHIQKPDKNERAMMIHIVNDEMVYFAPISSFIRAENDNIWLTLEFPNNTIVIEFKKLEMEGLKKNATTSMVMMQLETAFRYGRGVIIEQNNGYIT